MIVSDLKHYLEGFYNNSLKSKSLLIDGRWGCGKTYNTKQFISEKNANGIYLSLFGINNCNEIVLKLSEYLDSTYIVQIGNHFLLKDNFDEYDYNNVIVVFDDLERIKPSIDYTEIYCLVDKLKRLGFKVICICDSREIDDSSFNEFKEKTFDDIINVESDKSLVSTIAGLDITNEESLLKTVNDNWRIIQKAKMYYDSICKEFENNKCVFSETMNYSNDTLFRCIILATQCVYSSNSSEVDIKNDFQKIVYENDKDKYGTFAANELHHLFSEEKENGALKELVKLFIGSIKSHDFSSIISYSKPITNDSLLDKYPYNKEIFYLDDKSYIEYKELFIRDISQFDFSKKQHLRVLENYINNYCDELKEEEMNLIIKRMLATIDSNEINMFLERLTILRDEPSQKLNVFKTKLTEELLIHSNNQICEKIENSIDKKEYSELTNIIFENRWAPDGKKDYILRIFESKSFVLPDLAKEIDQNSWTFCHEIAKYVANTNYESKFIQCLKDQCSQSNSTQLRRRCKALVKYNFNKEIVFD